MNNWQRPLALVALLAGLSGCTDEGESPLGPDDGRDPVSYSLQIQPVFDANCVGCHGIDGNAGLDLRPSMSRANLVGIAAQASAGIRVTPGNSTTSVIYNRLTGNGLGVMPPDGSLVSSTLDLFSRWIDEGAADN